MLPNWPPHLTIWVWASCVSLMWIINCGSTIVKHCTYWITSQDDDRKGTHWGTCSKLENANEWMSWANFYSVIFWKWEVSLPDWNLYKCSAKKGLWNSHLAGWKAELTYPFICSHQAQIALGTSLDKTPLQHMVVQHLHIRDWLADICMSMWIVYLSCFIVSHSEYNNMLAEYKSGAENNLFIPVGETFAKMLSDSLREWMGLGRGPHTGEKSLVQANNWPYSFQWIVQKTRLAILFLCGPQITLLQPLTSVSQGIADVGSCFAE